MFEKFKKGTPNVDKLGPSRDYNVDLIPKFITSCGTYSIIPNLEYSNFFKGTLVNILVKTDVTRYLEFKAVDGSFVVQGDKVYKVPSTAAEAFKSPLMGIFEKKRCANFLEFVGDYDEKDPKTHKGMSIR